MTAAKRWFGEGKLEQKTAFEALKRQLGHGAASGTLGFAVSNACITALPIVAVGGAIGGLGFQAVRYFSDKIEAKALRYEQTTMAIYNFVLTELDAWFGLQEQ